MAASLTLLLVALDQLTKALVEAQLALEHQVAVIDNFFYIVHVRNSGAAFSLLADRTGSRIVLSAVSLAVSLFLIFWIGKMRDRRTKIILAVILGGSLGNLIDRIRLGAVTDFLSFRFGSYAFPSFNVADICVTLGVLVLFAFVTFDRSFSDRLFASAAAGKKKTSDAETAAPAAAEEE